MKEQALNPYLPSWEYVPDAEPRVFGDRVYIYGSHDRFGAPMFCVNDYVCYSAPVDDLSQWKYEGVVYGRKDDPNNFFGIRSLYAPDVVQGPDGRYFMYYAYDFLGRMGVAVSDKPAGRYKYLGCVRFSDGHIWGTKSAEPFPFDPGVLVDDDGKVYLYSGFATKVPSIASRFHNLKNDGGVVLELEKDMLTIVSGPKLLFPTKNHPGAYEGHAFFEASSIRKVDGKYCFVYSSQNNHDLCYAMSSSPAGPFTYGGTLIDIGDIGIGKVDSESRAKNYLGNTHGGMLEIGGQWYIFYHRQTNRSSYARQACAEKLTRKDDGGFLQSEVTSCGLNPGPLEGTGRYEARIACNLYSGEGTGRYDCHFPKFRFRRHPYFTQTGRDREENGDQYIANMRNGAVAGFKYFSLGEASTINVTVKGKGSGNMLVSTSEEFPEESCLRIPINVNSTSPETFSGKFRFPKGTEPLYFKFEGKGKIDFIAFELCK